MSEAIRGDVLTRERQSRRDVRIQEGDRGGITFYAPSYLDVLLENDVITESHKAAAQAYWSIREASLAFMGASSNPLFRDVVGENSEYQESHEHEGEPMDLFMLIKLSNDDRHIIDLCCQPVAGNALAIVWAFGMNSIEGAFDALEKELPEAREKLKEKMKDRTCIYA